MNTTYYLNLVAGNVFRSKTSPGIPSNYYIGMSKTTPTLAGGNVTEPAASAGYARVKLTGLSAPSDGVVTNNNEIQFAESTAAWGKVTHYVVYDAATGGNLLMYGALPEERTIESGTAMIIKQGNLKLSIKTPS